MQEAAAPRPSALGLQPGAFAASGRNGFAVALLLLAVAVLARLAFYGNPVIEGDEQFYLLVGDRLLQGTLPYVGVWDRKPVGLFLIYAAIRALGGEGIVQYQIVATIFAAGTAFLVTRIAAEVASSRGALFAGITYILWLNVFGGEGGQSPVFYNLPVAGAALLTLWAVARPGSPARLLGLGAAAMLATGLAMQIKYTAVFEGMFFGCALLWAGWRSRAAPSRLLLCAAAWIACALLPTLAALAAYAAMGELQAFVFANFTSVFQRNTAAVGSALGRLASMAGLLLPLAACAVLGLRMARRAAGKPEALRVAGFLAGWLAMAVAGVLLFGTYYNHYALPLLVPLSVAAAPLLGSSAARLGPIPAMLALSLVAVTATGVITAMHLRSRGNGSEVRALAEAVTPGASLYVFDGETILYFLTRSPLPTPYVFPTHLNDLREVGGIGVDPVAELRRILASRPAFIATTDTTRPRINPASWALLSEALRTEYQPIRSVKIGNRNRVLYQRLR
jgi:4-amino-4-deoxy-L-arabinose transferase-like glycosyltransferase